MNRRRIAITLLGANFFLLFAITSSAKPASMSRSIKPVYIAQKYFEDDKRPAKKERSFKNQDAVKVLPDAIKKAVHVIARPGNKKELDFLVFDVNGNMVLDYKMKAGERKTISDLVKGSYMYYVFAEDEYLMTGKIVFR
jgi:hypothetical protein